MTRASPIGPGDASDAVRAAWIRALVAALPPHLGPRVAQLGGPSGTPPAALSVLARTNSLDLRRMTHQVSLPDMLDPRRGITYDDDPARDEHLLDLAARDADALAARLARREEIARRLMREAGMDGGGAVVLAALSHDLDPLETTDLPADLVRVDRTLAWTMRAAGIDPAALVRWHRSRPAQDLLDTRAPRINGPAGAAGTLAPSAATAPPGIAAVGIALHAGDDHPTLVAAVRIGTSDPRVVHDHACLHVDAEIPETLAAAAVGRSLGSLVSTRVPGLDERMVVSAVTRPGRTTIDLAPDDVTIRDTIAYAALAL